MPVRHLIPEKALSPASGLTLDVDAAREQRTKRAYRLHAFEIPLLRLLGLHFLTVCVFLHNLYIVPDFHWQGVLGLYTLMLVYCLGSWGALARWYGRTPGVDLGLGFLCVDMLFFISIPSPKSLNLQGLL